MYGIMTLIFAASTNVKEERFFNFFNPYSLFYSFIPSVTDSFIHSFIYLFPTCCNWPQVKGVVSFLQLKRDIAEIIRTFNHPSFHFIHSLPAMTGHRSNGSSVSSSLNATLRRSLTATTKSSNMATSSP